MSIFISSSSNTGLITTHPEQGNQGHYTSSLCLCSECIQLGIVGGILVYRSFIFRQAAFFSPFLFLLPPGFGSFTEKPVSYLIGIHFHSLIQQSHKSRESQGKITNTHTHTQNDCITQYAELLILNKIWNTLRKMQNIFLPPSSYPVSATLHHHHHHPS